jgi:hypothetical protein
MGSPAVEAPRSLVDEVDLRLVAVHDEFEFIPT